MMKTAKELKDEGKTVSELFKMRFTHKNIVNAGYSIRELYDGGFIAANFREFYKLSSLKAAGLNPRELLDINYSRRDPL